MKNQDQNSNWYFGGPDAGEGFFVYSTALEGVYAGSAIMKFFSTEISEADTAFSREIALHKERGSEVFEVKLIQVNPSRGYAMLSNGKIIKRFPNA